MREVALSIGRTAPIQDFFNQPEPTVKAETKKEPQTIMMGDNPSETL